MAKMFSVNLAQKARDQADYQVELGDMTLPELVQEFLSYLDYQEVSESGKVFQPVTVACSRAMMITPLRLVLTQLRERVKEYELPH